MVVFLNLDEVIRIIRNQDQPKPMLMQRWKLTEAQAEAILNMRLRALRKLEEIEIRSEIKGLEKEQKALKVLMEDTALRWKSIAQEISNIRKRFGKNTDLGKRRTEIGEAPSATIVPITAMIEREPITVICSQMGWIRAAKGHVDDVSTLKFKEGDRFRFALHAHTTDKVLMFGTNGRFYTFGCDRLPSGRGHGEPVRLITGLGNDHDVVDLLIHVEGRKLIIASSDGRGFLVQENDVVAQTRGGKRVLNVSGDVEARVCRIVPESADHVASVGENHKVIIFPIDELSEMSRGRGMKLQSYKDGGLSDVKAFSLSEGLSWKSGERTRTETDIFSYVGKRTQAGRLAPKGFPRSNKFG